MNSEKTSIEKLANMNLEGLLLPEPIAVSYWWVWVIAALLIAIIAWVWIKKYGTAKATALRELEKLRAVLNDDKQDTKYIKVQIAQSLRQGFKVTRLDSVMPDNMKWREYLSTLEMELYAKETSKLNESQTLRSLIKDGQTWLKTNA